MLTGSLSWDLESPYLFDHFEVQRGVGATKCLAFALSDVLPVKVVALRLHRRKSDEAMNKLKVILYPLYKRRFSHHQMAGFARDQLAVWDANLSTRPLQRATHTRRASFVPRRLLDIVTTGDDQTNEIWDYLPQKTLEGHKSNVSFGMYQPNLPITVIGYGGGTVRSLLGYTSNYPLHQECTMWQPD